MAVNIDGEAVDVLVDSPPASISLLRRYGEASSSLQATILASALMRAIDPAQAASESPTAVRTPVEVQIWNPTNTAMLAIADGRMSMQWLDDLNDAGTASFTMHRYDPKATPENMALFNLAKFVHGGRVRFVSRIERRRIVVVEDGDHHAQAWRIDGRGALSLLSDAVLYSEYGIDEFTRKQRSFFFGSKEGSWYVPSEWSPPRGLPLSDVPADHPWKGSPQGWVDPDAQWIWPTDPNTLAVPGPAWFRSTFTLAAPTTVTVYATADDQVVLYVDGYPALAMGGANQEKAFTKGPAQFSIKMGAGPHLIAAEVRNSDESLEEVRPVVTANEVVPVHATNSNIPYIGKGIRDGGNPYVNGDGSVDGGGTGDVAFDGDPASYWMSVGNYPGWTSAYEYVEGTFDPQFVTAVRVHVRGGPYTAYISLKDGGNGWNGNATVPYSARVVNTGANIRYVRTVRIEHEQDATIDVPPQLADRVRITLRADWDSGVWQYRRRACIRTVRVTGETRTGSYIRGGNFAGLLVTVVTQDDNGAVTGVLHRSRPEDWLCKTGDRPGWTPAHILTHIFKEAVDRSVLGTQALKLGFTDVADSYGMPWTTPRKDVAYDVGTDYLSLVKKLSEDSQVDVWVDVEDMTLNAAEQRGKDRTRDPGAVVLRPGQSLLDFSIDSARPQSTRLVVESDHGWLERGDFEAELTYGRVEGFASLGSALSMEEAGRSADNELQRFAAETWDSTTSTTGVIGPRPYIDYDVGDYVMLPTGFGSDIGINRVLSFRISEDDSGSLEAVVELDRTPTVPERTDSPPPQVPQPPVPGQPPGGGAVGVPQGTVLKVLSTMGSPNPGDALTSTTYTVNTPGAILDGWKLDRNVIVRAPGVVFTNCLFSGGGGGPLVVSSSDRSLGIPSFTATRCSMIPDFPDSATDGVHGSNFELHACEITGTVDGVQQFGDPAARLDPYAGNVLVEDCWIHDLVYYDDSHPSSPVTGTHNDGARVRGGSNIRILRNIFSGTMGNAGVYVSQENQDVSGLTIEGNSFGPGSAAAVDVYDNAGSGPVVGLRIASNVFASDSTGYTMRVSSRTVQNGAPYIQGNIWSDGRQPPPRVATTSPPPPAAAGAGGAQLPVDYRLEDLPGTVRYVSATGSDGNSGLTAALPKKTLDAACAAASPGDSIVVRGGTYPISANTTTVSKPLLITAYPGEIPVFDGSIPAPATTVAEGNLRRFVYQPVPSKTTGEGIGLTSENAFFAATFDGSGKPTGLAAERGFADVLSATTYLIPPSQTQSAVTGTARVITGVFPDQCWVGDKLLTRVFVKALVRPGHFYVQRSAVADDDAPAATNMYLHSTDALNMSSVRVSGSYDFFLNIAADNVTIRGIRVQRHSNKLGFFPVQTATGISGFTMEDVQIIDSAKSAIKLYGDAGSGFDGSELVKDTVLRRVTVSGTGWLGMSAQYTDDTLVTDCLFENINRHSEINNSPKSGAIKGTKNHRMVIEFSIFRKIPVAHAVWLDQSNYDCVFASNHITDFGGASLFWEISHKILIANNLIVKSGSGINLRVSGGSGVQLVNNTIVGGSNPVYIIAENRGAQLGGRWLSEHTERYGSGSYTADTGHPSSDLDKARGGAYAATNLTPGMNWRGGADAVVNNVIVHTAGSGPAIYFRGRTSTPGVSVPADEVVPRLIDGNIYQSQSLALAEVDTAAGDPGGVPVASSVAVWRGVGGIGQPYYALVNPEAASRGGSTVWVAQATGEPQAPLEAIRDMAGVSPPYPALDRYVPRGNRRYGAFLVPRGGW